MDQQFYFNSEKHEFSDAQGIIPSVTQVLRRAGLCDYSFIDQELRDRSMKRGTSVHWMTRLEDEGALNYRRLKKAMRGYRIAWRAWVKNSGVVFHWIEKEFVVGSLRYAGIIDRFGYFPWGGRGVIDIKTGPIQDATRYQLSGYAGYPSIYRRIPVQDIRRIAVRLKEDGTYQVREFKRETAQIDWAKFVESLRKVQNGEC